MSKIQALPKNALTEIPSSQGISRHLAFKGEDFLVVRARSEPETTSGWHHHGDYDVYGYLVSGSARFESNDGKKDAISLRPGDFFHVLHHTVHGTGPMVINLDDPDQA